MAQVLMKLTHSMHMPPEIYIRDNMYTQIQGKHISGFINTLKLYVNTTQTVHSHAHTLAHNNFFSGFQYFPVEEWCFSSESFRQFWHCGCRLRQLPQTDPSQCTSPQHASWAYTRQQGFGPSWTAYFPLHPHLSWLGAGYGGYCCCRHPPTWQNQFTLHASSCLVSPLMPLVEPPWPVHVWQPATACCCCSRQYSAVLLSISWPCHGQQEQQLFFASSPNFLIIWQDCCQQFPALLFYNVCWFTTMTTPTDLQQKLFDPWCLMHVLAGHNPCKSSSMYACMSESVVAEHTLQKTVLSESALSEFRVLSSLNP